MIEQIEKNQNFGNNLRVTFELAQAFNKTIVAESVGSRIVFDAVKKLGANYAAGDLIGKPSDTPFIQANRVE